MEDFMMIENEIAGRMIPKIHLKMKSKKKKTYVTLKKLTPEQRKEVLASVKSFGYKPTDYFKMKYYIENGKVGWLDTLVLSNIFSI